MWQTGGCLSWWEGIVEAALDGETALLIDPENTEALIEQVSRLAQDRELAQKLGRAGRQRILDRFSKQAIDQADSRDLTNP